MPEYVQRVSNMEEFPHPMMVALRTSLTDKFYDLVGKGMKDVGAHYFAHNLVKNPYQEGHIVSSFFTNMDWQEKYWNHYWDCDSLADTNLMITKSNGCSIISWKILSPNSDCMEDRMSLGKTRDGFTFWVEHNNGVLENFSFGWKKYDISRINRRKLAKLSNMVTDFRIQHFRLNQDMFDVFPAVQFH